MADSPLSSDLEPGASPPPKSKCFKSDSGKQSTGPSHKPRKPNSTSGQDRDVLRCHKALEHQCDKAQRCVHESLGLGTSPISAGPSGQATMRSGSPDRTQVLASIDSTGPANPLALAKGVSRSLPDVSIVGTSTSRHKVPEATFTPTAMGLCAPEVSLPGHQLDFHSMISSSLSTLLAAGLQQAVQGPLQALAGHQPSQEQPSSQLHSVRQRRHLQRGRSMKTTVQRMLSFQKMRV